MTDPQMRFVEGFSTPTPDEWKAEVEKALKGAPFDKKMLTKTYEGITLRPIYTRQDWPSAGDPSGFPGATPFTRGGRAAGNRANNWDARQVYAIPDPAICNDVILNELARGITSVTIRFDEAGRNGLDPDCPGGESLAGTDGVMIASVDDLDRLLTGVYLDLAPVALDAGAQFLPAAAMLTALWHRRRVDPAKALGAFNADPLGALATSGRLPSSIEGELARMSDLAKHTAATFPMVTAIGVDSSIYLDAGATESQDLAVSMATAVAYLKAMTAAGMDVDSACKQMLFTYSVGADQFLTIAKLRAARKMWARIAEACGAAEAARAMKLNAVTCMRMMSQRDPWVNMLRTTVACFAAAVGGADSITIRPFNSALGLPDELGRRVARNTHIILAEESNLAKVIDPAGGSWYVESRTDDLARVAWSEFQEIEKAGGIVNALTSGSLKAKIAQAYGQREANLAKRRDPVTGVSEFPNILEGAIRTEAVDIHDACARARDRVKATRETGGSRAAAAVEAIKGPAAGTAARAVAAAEAGATLGAMAAALAGAAVTVDALPRHRLGERFEVLRDASDQYLAKTGKRPQIFLANLGPIAQHTGRATFSKNFFEVAGIQALSNNGFADAGSCAEAFKASGASIAILCSADPIYEQMVAEVAPALKAAGCEYLFLAGNPGEKKEAYTAAGVDDYIMLGGDVLQTTRATLARLGVIA
jgi:methylmalonyl-CoA mutase